MEKKNTLENIEEKIVFRISRLFFLTLVIISMLVIVTGLFYLIYGFSSTTNPIGPYEAKISITSSEVTKIMNDSSSQQANEQSNISINQLQEQEDPDKIIFDEYVDTLKVLLPESIYSWEPKDIYLDGQYSETDIGITQRVNNFLETLNGYKEYNNAFESLCGLIRNYPEDKRLKPLVVFIDLYKQKLEALKESQTKAEQEYQETIMNKEMAKYQSMIAIGAAVSAMAFLAIFLVLLSMQRNIKLLSKK